MSLICYKFINNANLVEKLINLVYINTKNERHINIVKNFLDENNIDPRIEDVYGISMVTYILLKKVITYDDVKLLRLFAKYVKEKNIIFNEHDSDLLIIIDDVISNDFDIDIDDLITALVELYNLNYIFDS
jgi:hypothetical protein